MRLSLLLFLLVLGCDDGSDPAQEAPQGDTAVSTDAVVDAESDGPTPSDVGFSADGPEAPSDGASPDSTADALGLDPDAAPPPMGCLGAVVQVAGVEIFQYEASRPDATGDNAGADDSAACSRPGVLPWTFLTIAEARAACEASGFRLCHGEDWQSVCTGDPPMRPWPYGSGYQPSVCNDHINGAGMLEPTGARDGCRTPEGVFDLSGNVWEFTDEGDKRGSSYKLNAVMFRQEVTSCLQTYSVLDFFEDDDVGFRCCRPI